MCEGQFQYGACVASINHQCMVCVCGGGGLYSEDSLILPSIVKLVVFGADMALLMTEYTYTPGRLPVTVSVLR